VIGSKAGVSNDVRAGEEMLGAPAAPLRQAKLQMAAVAKLPEMRRQFRIMQRQLEELRTELGRGEPGQATDKAA
jgi:UDP-3-O-[3-hydroxymyristoyl] glucosamine N-acyltransferase